MLSLKSKTFHNVSRFHANNDFLFLFTKNNLIKLNGSYQEIWKNPVDCFGFSSVINEFIITAFGINNHFNIYHTDNGNLKYSNTEKQLHPNQTLNSNQVIITDPDGKTFLFNIEKEQICLISDKKTQASYIFENYIFVHQQKFNEDWQKEEDGIKTLDLKSGKELHYFNGLNDYDTLKILGCLKNRLWIKTNNGFMGIDHNSNDCIKIPTSITQHAFSSTLINQYTETLIQLTGHYPLKNESSVLEYSALDGEMMRNIKVTELEEKNYCFTNQFTLSDDRIYAIVQKSESLFGAAIAIIDYKTLKLIHIILIEDRSGFLNLAPAIDKNRLFVLDSGGSLHAYDLIFN